jgi:hypothetical protein
LALPAFASFPLPRLCQQLQLQVALKERRAALSAQRTQEQVVATLTLYVIPSQELLVDAQTRTMRP